MVEHFENSEDMFVGEKLKGLRLANNYTQEYLGELLSIGQTGYSKIELNQVKLSIDKALIIADLYKIDVAYLLREEKGSTFNNYGEVHGGGNIVGECENINNMVNEKLLEVVLKQQEQIAELVKKITEKE